MSKFEPRLGRCSGQKEVRDPAHCLGEGRLYYYNYQYLCERCVLRWIYAQRLLPRYGDDGTLKCSQNSDRVLTRGPAADPIPKMVQVVREVRLGDGIRQVIRTEVQRYEVWLEKVSTLNDPSAREWFRPPVPHVWSF